MPLSGRGNSGDGRPQLEGLDRGAGGDRHPGDPESHGRACGGGHVRGAGDARHPRGVHRAPRGGCGADNPLALLLNRRFINLDLNASFGVRGVLYEQLRAPQVLKKLNSHGLVIDFHTFSCDSPPFAIVVDESMIPLASSLGVEHVVHMRHNIKKGHALINFRDGVSVEVGAHKDQRSFDLAQQIVMKLKNNGIKPQSVRVYEVFGKIEEPGNYQNFVRAQDGIIPVLYGEKAYIKQGFYGLIAREIILKGGDTHERAQ